MAASDLRRAIHPRYPGLGAKKTNSDERGEDAFNDCPPELNQDGRREVQLKLPQTEHPLLAFFDYSGDDCQPRESEIAVPRDFKKAFIFRESAFASSS